MRSHEHKRIIRKPMEWKENANSEKVNINFMYIDSFSCNFVTDIKTISSNGSES